MSEAAPLPISIRHYQAVCGLALATIFLVHLQQDFPMLLNALILVLGVVGIFGRGRLSPLFFFITLAVGHLVEQYNQNQFLLRGTRWVPLLDLANVLLSMATLTYMAGQYRLHGLWFKTVQDARSEKSMSPAELMWLVLPAPLFAILAELFALGLRQQWDLVGYPPRWRQFLCVAWLIVLGMFAAGHLFRHWRRLQMDQASALLMLQDILWHETRGEQRRINRWIAWRKVKEREEEDI